MKILNSIYVAFFTLNALSTAIVTALTGANWTEFTVTQRFVLVWAIAGSWSNTMLALTTKLASREAQGRPLVPTDETSFMTKPQTESKSP